MVALFSYFLARPPISGSQVFMSVRNAAIRETMRMRMMDDDDNLTHTPQHRGILRLTNVTGAQYYLVFSFNHVRETTDGKLAIPAYPRTLN